MFIKNWHFPCFQNLIQIRMPVTSTHASLQRINSTTTSSFSYKFVSFTKIRHLESKLHITPKRDVDKNSLFFFRFFGFLAWKWGVEVKYLCWSDGFVVNWHVKVTDLRGWKEMPLCWSDECVQVRGTLKTPSTKMRST